MKRSLRSRVLSVLMALVMVFSVFPVSAFAAESDSVTATLVTDVSELKAGDQVVIVAQNASYALSTNQKSNNRGATAVTKDGNNVDLPSDIQMLTLEAGSVDGTFAFNTGSGYLYAASSSKNYLRTETSLSANSSWKITIAADGTAAVVAQGTNTRATMQYNPNNGSPLFACYSSASQQAIALYKVAAAVEDPYKDIDAKYSVYEKVDTISAGDVVVIYNAASGKAVSSVYANSYSDQLKGESVTVTDNYIATDADAIEWTVAANEGAYTFAQGNMMLAAAADGNYWDLTVDASDTTGWSVKQCNAENSSYYLYSSTLTGQYGNVYLEWYASKSAFSAYCTGESRLNENDFGFQFYKLVREGKDEGTGGDGGETPTPDTPTALIPDGDYVIWAPAYNKALSSGKVATYYNAGVDVTASGDKLEGYGDTEIWTVTNNADGSITISQNGQKLSMAASNSSMTMDGVNDTWTLVDLGNGLFNVKNDGRGNFIEWYNKYSNWSTYNSSSAATDGQFQLSFYAVPKTPTALIPDGDYVIWAPAYNKALSSGKVATYYNAGVDVTASGDKLEGYGDTEIWTVTNNADGSITISQNGQKLSMAASNSSMTMDGVNDTWTPVDLGNGLFNVKNDGRGNFIEWYNKYSNWSTYNSSSAATDGQFQLSFYAVPKTPTAPVPDGDYVIWAPAYNMALSGNYTGYYNKGTAVTLNGDKLAGYTAADIWTVKNNDDGTITISYNDQNLAMGDSFSSMPLGEKNDKWVLEDAGNGLFYVKNSVRGSYIEWYASKNNWSGYNYINSGSEGMFALQFTPAEEVTTGGLPTAGDKVVIYNLNAKGVLAAENDTQSIENAAAEIVDGKAIPENGGVVFTVEKSGSYFRFVNETYGYLCSNGTGNNAFYSKTASEDADWTLETLGGGYKMLSRVAKYNGTSAQYLEYYADSYKTYSFYATNKDGSAADTSIYEFYFYPVADGVKLTGGIVNDPQVVFGTLADAFVGADYTFSFTVDAAFGVKELTVTVNGETITANADGTYTIPAEKVTGTELVIAVAGKDNKDVAISGTATVAVKDEPTIGAVTPAAGSQTLENKRPVISAVISNAKDGATVTMTVNGEAVEAVYADGKITYTPAADMADGRTSVTVTVVRADGKETSKTWSFTVGKAQYALYFGQLHSHTTYSDGSGSLESALEYVKNLPESANVDFVAFTDHSNYFDASGAANPEGALYDMSLATANSQKLWGEYKDTIAKFNNSQGDVIAIGGFEMTWSGGPGHINTFNTPGIVSRNNTTLNNKTSDAGMKAYYALLSQAAGAGSISQFNHPGSTFGTFTDFAYWDALVDTRIQLVEVGNGEGQVGAGGYFPSYEYYTMALDKGWHVAPTNNQDNHKGKWGNANEARDVVLTDDFSEQGIYQAIRDMRMYSTEDKNLEIGYTVNGLLLGSIIEEVPEKLDVNVTVYDPDAFDSISKVELIVNSGKVAYTWDDPADLSDGALSATLDPDYSYYYVRVTEGDGDLAVTAPVWVGEMLKLGISSVECGTSTPVTDEEVKLTTTFFNSESAGATVKSLTYTTDGSKVVGTDTKGYTIPASGTASVDFKYTPTVAKVTKITVTAVVEQDGKEYTFTMDVTLDVQDASKLVYIGIDASHYNEYVNGNYKDSMGNFSKLAAEYNVRTVQLNTSEELIAACANEKFKAIILTAPSRRSAEAQAANPLKVYTAEELAAINAFNQKGGTVILAGWSDHYENYPDVSSIANMKAEEHMAATQNAVLSALGSSLRIGDDATYDDTYNGGQAYRLYFNTYGESFLTEGVEVDPEHPHDRLYTEVFSHYGGASVYTVDGTLPTTVAPVVFGHSGTYSVDVDKDGLGGDAMPKYACAEGDNRLMIMATEQLAGRGLIIVSGAAFMSNFEVQATIEDSGSEKNYSNYKVCENLLKMINPVTITDIAEVQAQTEPGYKYTIEGIVTSNASGYDKDTAFFDCIYVQDATGGVCCFPVAGNFKIGDKVRVTGTTEFYQGEMELQVSDIELIGEGYSVTPANVFAKQVNDGTVLGQLITVKGTVDSFELANGLVQTIMVKDEKGELVRVFIDGYITTDEDVKNLKVGNKITVTGIASYDDTFNAPNGPFPRIRVRDRADVVCTTPAPATGDHFQMGLWLSLMALTAAAAAVLLQRKGKEQF